MPAKVLIVDDTEHVRKMLVDMLELDGFDVVGEAADGASGLALAGELEPDVVLLDIALPDMSGFDVAERLSGPSVVLTSSREPTDFGPRLLETQPSASCRRTG